MTSANAGKATPKRKWYRDPIWQFIGSILAALAIVASYHIFFSGQERRGLRVVLLANSSLVEVEPTVAEEIRVYYQDKEVSNLSLVQVLIENTGTEEIVEEDYARPISFQFGGESQIVEATLDSNPPNIGVTAHAEGNTAILSRALLNQDDRVTVRFLVINMPVADNMWPFQVDARIAGIERIRQVDALAEKAPGETGSSAYTVPAWWAFVLLSLLIGLSFLSGFFYWRMLPVIQEGFLYLVASRH